MTLDELKMEVYLSLKVNDEELKQKHSKTKNSKQKT